MLESKIVFFPDDLHLSLLRDDIFGGLDCFDRLNWRHLTIWNDENINKKKNTRVPQGNAKTITQCKSQLSHTDSQISLNLHKSFRQQFDDDLRKLQDEHDRELEEEKQATKLALDVVQRAHREELQKLKANNPIKKDCRCRTDQVVTPVQQK